MGPRTVADSRGESKEAYKIVSRNGGNIPKGTSFDLLCGGILSPVWEYRSLSKVVSSTDLLGERAWHVSCYQCQKRNVPAL